MILQPKNVGFFFLLAAVSLDLCNAIPQIVVPNSVHCDDTKITFQINSNPYPLANVGTGAAIVTQVGSSCALQNNVISATPPTTAPPTITIPGNCTTWSQILGPDGSEAYSTTSQSLVLNSTDGSTDIEYYFHVDCIVSKNVVINGGVNNTGGGGGNGGGGGTNTTNDIELYITNEAGARVNSVPESTPLILNIKLKTGQKDYNSTMPFYCYFSNGVSTGRLYLIQDDCPNTNLLNAFHPLKKIKRMTTQAQHYQAYFDAFTYSSHQGPDSIHVTCDMLLCTNISRCLNPCWDHPAIASEIVESFVDEYYDDFDDFEAKGTLLAEKTTKVQVYKSSLPTSPTNPDEQICLSKTTVYTMYAGLGFLSLLLLLLIPACCCLVCCGAGAIGLGAAGGRRRHHHHHRHRYPTDDQYSTRYAASYSSRDGLARNDLNQWVSSAHSTQSLSVKSLPRTAY